MLSSRCISSCGLSFILVWLTLVLVHCRAICIRYLFFPLPNLVVFFGYGICAACLVLAFYSFLVYFRLAKPIGKDLSFLQKLRLGIPAADGSANKDIFTPSKSLLPKPAWATPLPDTSENAVNQVDSSSKRSPQGSQRFVLSPRKPNKSPSASPTSPKGRSKSATRSPSTPSEAFSWLARTATPSRLASPLSTTKPTGSPLATNLSPLSPNAFGHHNAPKAFPKVESPMLRRMTSDQPSNDMLVYGTSPLASPSSPSFFFNTSTTATPSHRKGTTQVVYTATAASPVRVSSPFSIESYTTTMSPLNTTHSSGASGARPSTAAEGALAAASPNWDYSFTDQSQLDDYVERQRRIETTKDYLNPQNANGGAAGSRVRPLKMPAYQSMAPRISSDKPSNSKEGAYQDEQAAQALYAKLGVALFMDQWTENFRDWMSARVLKPMVKWFSEVEARMGKEALYQPQLSQVQSGVQKMQTQQANMFSIKPTTGFNAGLGTGMTSTATQAQQQQQQADIQERMKLERIFGDFGSSREYVVERIRALSRGAVLQAYNWCGGGKWKDKEWTADLPTDAHIACHLFSTHLDNLVIATDAAHLMDAFRSKYLVAKDEKAKKPAFAIVQKSVNPPHYNLIVNHVEWNVARGRNNLFEALCLFLFVVRRDYQGVLDQRHLGGPIGLLELLAEEEY